VPAAKVNALAVSASSGFHSDGFVITVAADAGNAASLPLKGRLRGNDVSVAAAGRSVN